MKFLIVKTSSLGDILQSFPVATYLTTKFPGCQIDWVVEEEFAGLVKSNPQISNVLIVKTRKWRRGACLKELFQFKSILKKTKYDAVFDLQANIKSGLITFFSKSANKIGFGWKTTHEKVNLLFTTIRYDYPKGKNIRDDYLHLAKSFFSDADPFEAPPVALTVNPADKLPVFHGKKKVMVCPGSAWINKQLTNEQLIAFLKELQQKKDCEYVFCWGTEAEKLLSQSIMKEFPDSILLDRLSLPALQRVMSQMDAVVSMDSLPLHLAGTTSVETYSFFGPSLAAKFCPTGPQHHTYQGTCPYGRTFEKRCPVLRSCPTGACLRR